MSSPPRAAAGGTLATWKAANHPGKGGGEYECGETGPHSWSFYAEGSTSLLLMFHWPCVNPIATGPLPLNPRARQMCSPNRSRQGSHKLSFLPRYPSAKSRCSPQTRRSQRGGSMGANLNSHQVKGQTMARQKQSNHGRTLAQHIILSSQSSVLSSPPHS